ncbi:MAG: helix-turn-helix domain-containing protein, partial [Bacteroidales bacterium]|nr:helix-turn-helix domain-containing protein [Bacteroidales bacterium]
MHFKKINLSSYVDNENNSRANLSKNYLYKLTSGNLIHHYKPQGKMLYFEKEELEEWL